jgi:hypothetical protein
MEKNMLNIRLSSSTSKLSVRELSTKFRAFIVLQVVLTGALLLFGNITHAFAQTAGCLNILTYGGSGNGTTNNAPAFASAAAALPSHGGCISFPAGKYKFNSAVSLTYPSGIYSVTLVGDGADNTTLFFPASNGVTINAQNLDQSIHIHDLTFSTGSAGGYSALTLSKPGTLATYAQSDIFRTTFRGDDGGALTDYWTVGVDVLGLSNINFDTDLFYGNSAGTNSTGVALTGNASVSGYGVVYNIAKSGFYSLGSGVTVGTYIQGVTVTQSNFVNGTTGIFVPPGAVGVTEISITGGNNFNCTGGQVIIEAPVASVIMNGNLIYIGANTAGVWFDAPGSILNSFVNNVFAGLSTTGPSGTGILVSFTSSPQGLVAYSGATGNVFYNLAVGVDLTDAYAWNVQANSYTTVTNQVANSGPFSSSNSVGVATK